MGQGRAKAASPGGTAVSKATPAHEGWEVDSASLPNILTLSGLWCTRPHDGMSCLGGRAHQDATRAVVTALAHPPLARPEVLTLWASLPFPLLPHDRPPEPL